jgi:hypothetical protein
MARCLIHQNIAEYGDGENSSARQLYNHPSVQRDRQLFSTTPVPKANFPRHARIVRFFGRHRGGENMGKQDRLRRPRPKVREGSFVPLGEVGIRPE